MKSFIGRTIVAIVVLGATAIFLVNVGRMDDVVSFTTKVFGAAAGQHVDDFGNASEKAGQDVVDWTERARDQIESGETVAVDWSALRDAVDLFMPPTPERHPEYRRDEFGDGWLDTDGNGCDTRNDMLQRDLIDIAVAPDACTVLSGTLHDTYSGETIAFTRGQKTSSEVQIDHIVPLKLAWDLGAWKWSDEEREQFANDPMNLRAVKGAENSAKGARSIADWLPSDPESWCDYTVDYIAVHAKYDLAMDEEDRDMANELITACAG